MSSFVWDAIVVGSGPNGLSAAITLAERGASVLVLEASPYIGGAVATRDLTLPGFKHDPFSAVYPAAAASPVFARMPLAQHGLRWTQPAAALAHPLPDGTAVALYRDVAQTVQQLEQHAPGDGQRWAHFIAPYLKHREHVRHIFLGGFPPVRGALGMLAASGWQQSLEFARLVLMPATALADELFRSPHNAAWLYGSALHSDVPLDGAGSAIAGVYLMLLGHTVGWGSPAGGAGSLSRALQSYLRSLGGELRANARVTRLHTTGSRIHGVTLHDGEQLTTRRVIACVSPHGLLAMGAGVLPPDYAQRLQRYRYGPPSFKIDWALRAPIPWQAPVARHAGTIHLGGSTATLWHNLRQQHAGIIPEQPFLLCGQQSLADAERAPAGQHTAWAYTHPPRGLDWRTARAIYIERIEQHIESYAPGFRDAILARYVQTPTDLYRANANLEGGDTGGGSYALDQLVFRPVPALLPYRTPVRGLYIGSAATFPGGAVHGVCGAAAARLALREWWLVGR